MTKRLPRCLASAQLWGVAGSPRRCKPANCSREGYGPTLLQEFLEQVETLDTILLDSGSPQERGGTGKAFDWQAALPVVAEIKTRIPVMIAGGLNPENVGEAIRLFEPWGVDVVSGVEREIGKKDEAKLRAFVAAVGAAVAATK